MKSQGRGRGAKVAPQTDFCYTFFLTEDDVYNLNGIDSKFRLAILVARRAKQLIGGAKRKVDIKAENVLTIAMEEFRQGKIDFDVLNQDPSLLNEENQELAPETAAAAESEIAEDLETTLEESQPQLES
jgi:DNA-directed RNA polymerase subunit K/omega